MDVRQHLAQLIGELAIRIAELSAENEALKANQKKAKPPKAEKAKSDG